MMGKIQSHIRNQEEKSIRNNKKLYETKKNENLLPSVIRSLFCLTSIVLSYEFHKIYYQLA